MHGPDENRRREGHPNGLPGAPVEGPPPRTEAARSDVSVRVVRVPGGFAFVGDKVSTERTRAMYRMDDMATWREHSRDLLREAEEARFARHVNEARPKWGQTLTGKVRRGAALLLSALGLAAPSPTRSSPARGDPT
jgi:hypothetical protein